MRKICVNQVKSTLNSLKNTGVNHGGEIIQNF